MKSFMYLYTNVDFGMNFHPFWCNPCKILAFYTPHNKIDIELNQYVINNRMTFIHQKWCFSRLAILLYLSYNY